MDVTWTRLRFSRDGALNSYTRKWQTLRRKSLRLILDLALAEEAELDDDEELDVEEELEELEELEEAEESAISAFFAQKTETFIYKPKEVSIYEDVLADIVENFILFSKIIWMMDRAAVVSLSCLRNG